MEGAAAQGGSLNDRISASFITS